MIGQVYKFQIEKGFGFIECKNVEYFFHRDDYIGDFNAFIKAHQTSNNNQVEVSFEINPRSTKGPRAMNVVMV